MKAEIEKADNGKVRHELDAVKCPKCGGRGYLETGRGSFDCPECDASGVKAVLRKITGGAR